ncbi:MAG: TIGR04282 family arsenosugar biosynthesis glycosyltransferase, partial [Candidatus Methanoperedenaceae archaeon]|nr:TIGR04282 family arsenosugar biosynthesis glycosyltransferase [Candidatus Methanoperedenaceae archaeon]
MNAIVIMAKAPLSGMVKTRLLSRLESGEAAILYRCFLLDKIEQVKHIDNASHFIAYTPANTRALFRELIPRDFTLVEQNGAHLGERLSNISKNLFSQGFKKVIILDSDSPNLPRDFISEGLDRLDNTDVVLGPCEDGGYYLIGARAHFPGIFKNIPWSTQDVTGKTIEKAKGSGLVVSMLEPWYDVDTIDDLLRLKKDLDNSSRKNQQFFC